MCYGLTLYRYSLDSIPSPKPVVVANTNTAIHHSFVPLSNIIPRNTMVSKDISMESKDMM